MPTVQLDDDVFEELQRRAKPFVDTPSTTLRRILGLQSGVPRPARRGDPELDALLQESMSAQRTKAPKADLTVLAKKGLLADGEKLFLVDYQGKRIPHQEAVVAGSLLAYKGRTYTMSNLAQELLRGVGFKSGAVRGPSHWSNAKGATVTDLWQKVLAGGRGR